MIQIFTSIGVMWSMIVAVKSNCGNSDRRRIIRQTWGSYQYFKGTRLEVLFVVGLSSSGSEQDVIFRESKVYGDILQINKTEVYK